MASFQITQAFRTTLCKLAAIVACTITGAEQAISGPTLTHVDVYTSGQDGYHTYRIPAIETAPDGSLVAFAEARKYNRSDPGHRGNDVDMVLKRSTDSGRTWSKLQLVEDPGERWSACNPATLVDRDTGRLWLFHSVTRPDRNSGNARPGTDDSQAWARYSSDNGMRWSKPIDITRAARDVAMWGSSFYGPGGAIQDRNGRLIVPLAKTTGQINAAGEIAGGVWNAFTIFSDDHGKNWRRGKLLSGPDGGSESQCVELADGRILIDARQNRGTHRFVAASSDGGQTWSEPQPGQSLTPVACAIERYTLKSAGDDRNRIVWSGPKGPGRKALVVRVSYDEAETFGGERLISDDLTAYSDLTILKDGTVGVLWERGGYKTITFSRFNREFLEPAGVP